MPSYWTSALKAPGWKAWLAVAVGGLAGSELRYGLGLLFPEHPGTVPWTTLAINVSGSFVLALLTTLWMARPRTSFWLRAGIGPGSSVPSPRSRQLFSPSTGRSVTGTMHSGFSTSGFPSFSGSAPRRPAGRRAGPLPTSAEERNDHCPSRWAVRSGGRLAPLRR
ncbi:fluoride efflux transporter FluC [Arthrobacter sp. SA17]